MRSISADSTHLPDRLVRPTRRALGGLAASLLLGFASRFSPTTQANGAEAVGKSSFDERNLVAWCIVPFDAKKRTPEERGAMLTSLGIRRVAYDWREQHVAEFEREIQVYREREIEFFAFWDWHPAFVPLVRQYNLQPQFWITNPSPDVANPTKRVEVAAEQMAARAREIQNLGCTLGLYNHGGWGGEPENLIAVCETLRHKHGIERVGIVYNLHHAHEHIPDMDQVLNRLSPYLLCLNLNGMNDRADPKIVSLGQGQHDTRLLQIVHDSPYTGPLGIIGHREEMDVEVALRENLDGLRQWRQSRANVTSPR